jgi:hypothetical protein
MFKKSASGCQQDIFTSIPSMLKGQSFAQYNDESAWHNLFRAQIVNRVDELLVKPLFDDSMGAPNASARVLIGMMTLKEGFGWSDCELFEQCRFNLLVRSALGLFNIDDSLPAESTYYLFRKRIHEYQLQKGIDLIELVFQQITRGQSLDYQVSGHSIRMDSKLIGSNIAWGTRYEIVHNTLSLFCRNIKESTPGNLKTERRAQLREVIETESRKIVYRLDREEVHKKLSALGVLIYKLLSLPAERNNPNYRLLKRVFKEHFCLKGSQVELRPKEQIKAGGLQSPHDPDCTYRKKGNRGVKGYHTSVTETCDKDSLNLIVDVLVKNASSSEQEFFQSATKAASEILDHTVKDVHADGAYQSPENIAHCKKNNLSYYFTGVQGSLGRYDLELSDGKMTVTDTKTGEILPVRVTAKGKWAIRVNPHRYRYFTQTELQTCQMRKQVEALPEEIRNKRNNVEATIFQLCYFTRNNKTRYRGLIQTKIWAVLRCMWINLRRILNYVGTIGQKAKNIPAYILQKAALSFNSFGQDIFKRRINLTCSYNSVSVKSHLNPWPIREYFL